MKFNFLQIFLSALLFNVFNEFIRGTNVDIFAPMMNKVLPGDVRKPVRVFGIDFFLTRFLIRVINMSIALGIVYCITKKKNNAITIF